MALETTPLWIAAKEVMNADKQNTFFTYECRIFANKNVILPFKLMNMEILDDFNKNYCSEISIDVLLGYGDFITKILPYDNNLMVEIKRIPIKSQGDNINSKFDIVTLKYRAILKEKKYSQLKGSSPHNLSVEGANSSRLETVSFQLLDLTVESLRFRQIGGPFNNVSNKDVLTTLLTKETLKDQSSTTYLFKGVNIVKPTVEDLRTHVIIPDGLPLLDLPIYLQVKQGGIYSSGIGYFYYRGYWYIYPEFDVTRFKSVRESLTLLIIPSNKLPHVENTYLIKGKSVTILVTGQVEHEDNTEENILNGGNGVRYANANNMMSSAESWKSGKVDVSRNKNASEYTVNQRDTKVNFSPVTQNRITANNMAELSKLAKRMVSEMVVEWQNAVEDLLYPGMPVKAIFEHNNTVKTVYGVLAGAHYWATGASDSLIIKRHVMSAALNVYLDKVSLSDK